MKMLWKLTDNIKYEDCEVSAARAQSLPRLQARSSASLLSSPPAARGGWDKLCPALRPPLRFALRAQGRSRRGRLGTFPSFTLLLRSPLSHSPRPAPIFSGPVLSVAKDGRAWVFEVVLATGQASVNSACLSNELLRAQVTRVRKGKPLSLFNCL